MLSSDRLVKDCCRAAPCLRFHYGLAVRSFEVAGAAHTSATRKRVVGKSASSGNGIETTWHGTLYLNEENYVKKLLCLAAATSGLLLTSNAHAFDWADDTISWWYGPYFRMPGSTSPSHPNGNNVGMNNIEFTHTDGFKYGTNFFDALLLISNRQDPANSTNHQPQGAYEGWFVYRNDLSLNAITGSKAFSFGPVSDVGINTGFNWDAKNNYYASGEFAFQIGPSFHIKVPVGFWQISVGAYKEMNNDGFYGPTNFHWTYTAASSWNIPFVIGSVPLSFQGYVNVIGPKGNDYTQPTKTEVLLHPKLMVDVGQLIDKKKNFIEVGVGWEYWWHKFGANNSVGGAIQSTPFVEATLHF